MHSYKLGNNLIEKKDSSIYCPIACSFCQDIHCLKKNDLFSKMHLYALENNGKIISVHQASKQHNYRCLECHGAVRRRAGFLRTPHFFHLRPTKNCRQQGKSLVHLQTQCFFQSILPPDECQLEYPFLSINRIADVVWLTQKIVFEIQCSPIQVDEIQARNKDYGTQGFQVVWVLHDQRFNQWKVSAAENYLRLSPHYYTNITEEGEGYIYDQGYVIDKGIRKERLPVLRIDPRLPKWTHHGSIKHSSNLIRERFFHWPLYFVGDLLDNGLKFLDFDQNKVDKPTLPWQCYLNNFLYPYRLFFKILLEKVCK